MPALGDNLTALANCHRDAATELDHLAAAANAGDAIPGEPAWFTIYRQQAALQFQAIHDQAQANHTELLLAIRKTDVSVAALASWQESRAINGRARDMTSRLVGLMRIPAVDALEPGAPVPPLPAMLPPLATFPASMQALLSLPSAVLTELLVSYGQPAHGSLVDKRTRFCRFIGCSEY